MRDGSIDLPNPVSDFILRPARGILVWASACLAFQGLLVPDSAVALAYPWLIATATGRSPAARMSCLCMTLASKILHELLSLTG